MSLICISFCAVSKARAQEVSPQEIEALRNQGRFAEALAKLQHYIAALQARNKLETMEGAIILNNTGELYYQLGRYAEAVPYYERSISIAKNGVPGIQIAITYRNLGIVYQLTGRTTDAIAAYRMSVNLLTKFPEAQVQIASTLNNIATLLQDLHRYKEAEQLFQKVLSIYRSNFGENHLYVATAYNNLGQLYQATGQQAEAETMMLSANQVLLKVLNRDHPRRVPVLRNLGAFYFNKKEWAKAVQYYREALEILQKQGERALRSPQGELSPTDLDPALQKAAAGEFINAAIKLLTADHSQGVALLREVISAAQWSPSQTAESLLQMSARASAGGDELSRLLRKRQDLAAEWQSVQQALTQSALRNEGTPKSAQYTIGRLDKIGAEIAGLDASIARQFPEYAELTHPAPLDANEVQSLLHDDEALIMFIETGYPSWVWAITKQTKGFALINMSSQALTAAVAKFRCGLDQASWTDPSDWPETTPLDVKRKKAQKAVFDTCSKSGVGPSDTDYLPFDSDLAHKLYEVLFASQDKAIAGKHLLIVPSPALMQLPFAALVTEPAAPGTKLRDIKWLGTAAPLSILPSVASLRALRRLPRASQASKPFLGFGNPLLDGNKADPEQRQIADLARSKQTCGGPVIRTAEATRKFRAFTLQPAEAFHGRLADVSILDAQTPLPETADELCEVARSLKADPADIFLGARATEAAFKDLDRSGRLASYRVIHFATHGLVSGDLPGVSEPALLLTPPKVATEKDDGLLTASEVSQAKMDANWVVLSACNTASGGSEGAEALSGLARAFFYAGSRALLVTHWEISSEAAVKLTTGAFDATERNPRLSQAEAMRDAMAALVQDTHVAFAAHPAIWAAFELVGDGGRR